MINAMRSLIFCLLFLLSADISVAKSRDESSNCKSCATPCNKPCNILCNVCKPSCKCKGCDSCKCLPNTSPEFNWPNYGHDIANTRHATECKINANNVCRLQQKWTFSCPPVSGNPAIVDDVLYFGNYEGSVRALNPFTGALIWLAPNVIPSNPSNAFDFIRAIALTPAIGTNSVYVGGSNCVVIALDRATGAPLAGWPAGGVVVNDNAFQSIFSAPVLLEEEDLLFIMLGSFVVNPLVKGRIIALRASTGAFVWALDTTFNPSNPLTDGGPGVGIFGTPAVDTSRGLLFIGTGENYPPGPITPIADSLLALNYRTTNPDGEIVWHVQFTNDDVFTGTSGKDWDASSGPYLLTIKNCKGCKQDVVLIGTKEGKVRALDRATGALIWTTVLTNPNPQGSPLGGCNTFGCTDNDVIYLPSHYSTQGLIEDFCTVFDPNQTATGIFAVRASDGAILWRRDIPGGTVGALTLANGLLYHGTTIGTLRAFDVRNGAIVFEFQNPPLATPPPNCPANQFNALVGGTTVYKGMVYLPFGTASTDFVIPPAGPGGIIAFGLPS